MNSPALSLAARSDSTSRSNARSPPQAPSGTPAGSAPADLERRVIEALDLPEVRPRHPWLSSRNSQARARLQSRRTVATETPITSAASSRLRPPKYRSSTTRLLRGSTSSSAFSASSSARGRHGPSPAAARPPTARRAPGRGPVSPGRGTRHVDEDAAHDLRGGPEEMRPVLPLHVLPVHQPQVRLVDERRRLQEVARTLAGHLPRRQPVQLVLDHGGQGLERRRIAATPGDQELCDVLVTVIAVIPGCEDPGKLSKIGPILRDEHFRAGCRLLAEGETHEPFALLAILFAVSLVAPGREPPPTRPRQSFSSGTR